MATTSNNISLSEQEILNTIYDAVTNSLGTSLQTRIAGEDTAADVQKVEQRFSGTYINSATTTTVKTGAGMLHSITLTETAAGTITIYDNTAASGTVLGVLKASVVEGTYVFDVSFGTGLTIVTAAASKLTVSYR